MQEEQLTNQSLSIVVKLYQDFLQGLPDLFEGIDTFKANSYYQDVLRRDIKQTDECLCIAAEDEAVRLIEIKLQEKGIPWEKRMASEVQDVVKTNGMFVFLCRGIDMQRVQEAVQEIQKEFTMSHMPEPERDEPDLESELEREREREAEQTEQSEEQNEEGDLSSIQESEEEPEEVENDSPRKEKKKKTNRERRTEGSQSKTSYQTPSSYQKTPEPYRHEEIRQDSYSDTECSSSSAYSESRIEREAVRHAELPKESRKSSYPESLEREGLAGYNRYRETDFSHRPERETSRPSGDWSFTQESETKEQIGHASCLETQTEYSTVHPSQESAKPYQHEEKWLNADTKESSSYPESAKELLSEKKAAERQMTGSTEPMVGTESAHDSQKPYNAVTKPEVDEERPRRPSSESGYKTSRMGGFQSIGNERTILSTGRQTEKSSTESVSSSYRANEPYHPNKESPGKGAGGIQILGNGTSIQSPVETSQTTRGGLFSETVRQQAAQILSSSMQAADTYSDAGKQETRNLYHPDDITKALKRQDTPSTGKQSSVNIAITTLSSDAFTNFFQRDAKQDTKDSVLNIKESIGTSSKSANFEYEGFVQGNNAIKPSDSFNIQDQFRNQILASRRFYQVRGILSPDHFRSVFHASRRIAVQSVLSRETEAGRVAMDVIDYTAPVAIVMHRKLLANGAMQIARTTRCNMDVMAALYAAKFGVGIQEAEAALSRIRNMDMAMVLVGKKGLTMADSATFKAMGDVFELSNGKSLISMIANMDNNTLINLVQNLDVSDEFKKVMQGIPVKDLTPAKLQSLMKKFSGKNEKALLETLYSGMINKKFGLSGNFGFHTVLRGWLTRLLKSSMRDSDAARALGQIIGLSKNTYMAYRSGMRLLLTILNKIPFKNKEQLVSEIAFKVASDPLKAIGNKAARSAKKVGVKAGNKLLGNRMQNLMTKRSVQHASSALKFMAHPMRNITAQLKAKLGNTIVGKFFAGLSGKITALAAKVSSFLGWAAVIILVIILATSLISSIVEKQEAAKNSRMKPYNFAQDTEIVQEVITELTQKNEAFMAEINDAANHRGDYSTTAGLTTNENVSFYESYNIIFRDAYGNELEPSHVDLNNTKAILSMASKFMPYPFQKPSENASQAEKKTYEDIKQHFKDYCYFLWASTHQISIEEYHPGHSDGVEGAVDNSGLETTLDKGLCDKNGSTIWLRSEFTKDIVNYNGERWECESCDEAPSTGMGDELDDLCTHGKDDNAHGGWRMTGNKRYVYNCHSDHRHVDCDDDDHVMGTCEEEGNASPTTHGHYEYEWVYDCGGHMGSVVYVTIGDLSRDPGFDAAKDVDYNTVGQYGSNISGDDILNESGTLTYRGYAYTKSVDQSVEPFVYVYTLVEDGSAYKGATEEEAMNKFQQHVDTLPPKDTQNTETDNHTSAAN